MCLWVGSRFLNLFLFAWWLYAKLCVRVLRPHLVCVHVSLMYVFLHCLFCALSLSSWPFIGLFRCLCFLSLNLLSFCLLWVSLRFARLFCFASLALCVCVAFCVLPTCCTMNCLSLFCKVNGWQVAHAAKLNFKRQHRKLSGYLFAFFTGFWLKAVARLHKCVFFKLFAGWHWKNFCTQSNVTNWSTFKVNNWSTSRTLIWGFGGDLLLTIRAPTSWQSLAPKGWFLLSVFVFVSCGVSLALTIAVWLRRTNVTRTQS